jgi:hypothetical protein
MTTSLHHALRLAGGVTAKNPCLPASEVYGVTVAAPFRLLGGRAAEDRQTDIVLQVEEARSVGHGLPSGALLLDAITNGARIYAAGRDEAGCHLRIPGFADFDLDVDSGDLSCWLDPSANAALLNVFMTGMVPAFWMYLHDEVVLHASTVTARGMTVAIVGSSGMGKSTLAALLCGEGARLVGDDILRLSFGTGNVIWRGRSPELRLRPQAVPIADKYLPLCARRTTADGRLAVTPPAAKPDSGTLDMVIVPLPSRDGAPLSVRRAPALEALSLLASFPRLAGWRDAAVLRRQFDGMATLVNSVPVFAARVPWGPPFEAGLGAKLLDAVRGTREGAS